MVHLKSMGAKDEPWNKYIAKHGQPVYSSTMPAKNRLTL